MEKFEVSVIIPVYNAENYLRKAVESAALLDEVGEVILIEDASPDNAFEVALALKEEFNKVTLFQHPDKGNHGAGASRNLGIAKATCDYIAFLDADDYYLPNRFSTDKAVFATNPDCDGVYSAVGTHFYSDQAKQQFFDKGFGYQEMLTLSEDPGHEALFQVLFRKHLNIKGEFCTDGITVKKSVFHKVGFFNTQLRLRQDIHLWRRLAGFCDLYAGEIEHATAMRGIHAQNRMTVKEDHHQYIDLWWESLKQEFKTRHLDKTKYKIFEQAYFNYKTAHSNKLKAAIALFKNVLKYPSIVLYPNGVFDFNFRSVFGKNWFTLHLISFKNKMLNSSNEQRFVSDE